MVLGPNKPIKYALDTGSVLLKSQASAASLRSTINGNGSPRPSTPTPASVSYAGTEMLNSNGGSGSNVRVVVRCRGINSREAERGATCLIRMDPQTQSTTLIAPPTESSSRIQMSRKILEDKIFTFDNSFWSSDPKDEHYADQEDIYNCLGEEFLDHNFEGYHTCIFAYGQTGSGKSYTMMGTEENPGLIPRTCEDLFERIESNKSPNVSYSVRVSYFEVYNEQVRDLLVPRRDPPHYLKVRESPESGPYVKDLTELTVKNYTEVMKYMKLGDMSRTIASTKMNDTSSRSHAVFTLTLKQIHHDITRDETTERTARLRLIDLAGSERANATGATGVRLREGGNINKSLTTLGRVIAALAAPNSTTGGPRKKEVVPYRDSILTWLLKDSLGGNSKTAMIACISPTDYEETLSTLRYADQAKHIRTRAKINQDHLSYAEREQLIEEMAETIRNLQISVSQYSSAATQAMAQDLSLWKKQNELQAVQLEEYQTQVEKLQRLMEENRQVNECKINTLMGQVEALTLHNHMLVNHIRELRNGMAKAKVVEEVPVTEEDNQRETELEAESVDSGFWSDSEFMELETEVEERVDDLLKDLRMFKRKCEDDRMRFFVLSELDTSTQGVLRDLDVNKL